MKDEGLSFRVPTNIKKTCVFTRMRKIHNYHHFCVYDLAWDPPSDKENTADDDISGNLVFTEKK